MDDDDRLELQRLAGGAIISHPPLFSSNEECLFTISGRVIHVYNTDTGQLARLLAGARAKIVAIELELKNKDILVACTASGELLRWEWRSGRQKQTTKLKLEDGEVTTFNLLNMYGNSEKANAFVTVKGKGGEAIKWHIYDTDTGSKRKVPCDVKLFTKTPLVAVDNKNFKLIVVVQGCNVTFINYGTWATNRLKNAHKVPVTVVRVHPKELTVATGDELGKIFLWRQFMDKKTVRTSLYHWHHTSVTSIAFSGSGASFYSSGLEAVLVKWNVARPELRNFVPRMAASIQHIAVSKDNKYVVVCTADNGVQMIGTDNRLHSTLQEFTYIVDDKTGKNKFPVGLLLNPRNNVLVLNGRTGHLQFYSSQTRNLLYNMDIVMQNQLSTETARILYNIHVTKAAFNIDWMATGEVFNDAQHLAEMRLKFWKYDQERQSYVLNTNVELPHEGGFKCIRFSSEYQVDKLLCATVGEDNTIKMWALGNSDNIYRTDKVWYCVAVTNYKQLPVESICFSQDGSLLAAGFGNTLCLYKAATLRLRSSLSGPAGFDGCVSKAQVRVPRHKINGSKKELFEQHKKVMNLFGMTVQSDEQKMINELLKALQWKSNKRRNQGRQAVLGVRSLDKLDEPQRKQFFARILRAPNLNLFQRVQIFQKMGIRCKVHERRRVKMAAYLNDTVSTAGLRQRQESLEARLHTVEMRQRFKAKYRLQQCTRRKCNYDQAMRKNLVPILSLMNLGKISKQARLLNGYKRAPEAPLKNNASKVRPPVQSIAQITHVQFAAGEWSHIVLICTATRIIVWNLLKLRMMHVIKLSVEHLAFDPRTNLIAAFTKNHELHIFQPHVPMPIFQTRNIPKLYGAIWIPRRYPKMRSIHVNWQSQSTLYFLTETQEIMYLGQEDDCDADAEPITLSSETTADALRYSTFGTYAAQKHTDKRDDSAQQYGPLIADNTAQVAVKSFIEMSSHTMPPLSLICSDFLKSLITPAEKPFTALESKERSASPEPSALTNGHGGSDTEGELEDNTVTTSAAILKKRKSILAKSEEISQTYARSAITRHNPTDVETQMKRISALNFHF